MVGTNLKVNGMIPVPRLWRFACLAGLLAASASVAKAQNAPPISLAIDATDAPRRIFHAQMTIPAKPGALTLLYPKWIPGDHGPTGPIINLVGLKLTAAGKPVAWRRDDVEMYAFHCEVPAGATELQAAFDFLSPADANTTAQLAIVNWDMMVLYPQGKPTDELTYTARLRLPAGWKFGTALPVAAESADGITFKPVSLTTLVDSPVLAGANFRAVKLTEGQSPAHEIDIVSDSPAAMDMKPELVTGYQNLVREAGALFGARHYTGYRWLLTLSDHTAHFGLEHHESSDDRTDEGALGSEGAQRGLAGLLAHEYVHSWNGKYRRPAGLATPDYEQPMKGELLWVYEGLTNYLGTILPPRAGLWTPEALRDNLAATAATMDNTTGRAWRPLADTAIAAQILYDAPREWAFYRRGVDFYPEGTLLWLEVDVLIRQQTQGQRSLDDFCRAFHGGQSGPPMVKPYTQEDLIAALNAVAPYDWRGFFDRRLNGTGPHAPLEGITGGGWKLIYNDQPNMDQKATEERRKYTSFVYSLGMTVGESGAVGDIVPGLAADKAGLAPGMKLIAVNGRKYSSELLRDAVKASKSAAGPIELLAENGEFIKTYTLDYHGGERYPHLERDASKPDLLSEIIKPLAPAKP